MLQHSENILFEPKDEELVAKSLSLKSRSKELFGSTKDQVSSKEGSRRQPFQRGPLFRSRGNRGEEFSQLLVKPYNNNILQEDKEEVRTNLLKASSMRQTDLLSASEFSKIHPLVPNLFPVQIKLPPKAGRVEHFVKNLQILTNDPMIVDTVRSYKIPFILLPRQSRLPNSYQLIKERPNWPKEEQCLSSLFLVKKRQEEQRSSQPQGPEQKYHVSALQDGRVVPIKRNVVTRGHNMQDRPEGCILCNPLVSEIQEVFKIPVERPSIRVLFPLFWAFFSSSGSYKAIKSPYFSLEKAQCKNNNLPQRHATNDIFIRDVLIFILQHLGFLISKICNQSQHRLQDFSGLIVDPAEMTLSLFKEKLLKVQNYCQEIFEKWKVTVTELSKLIARLLSTTIAVLPAPFEYGHLQHQQIQKLIYQQQFPEKRAISVEAREELLCGKKI